MRACAQACTQASKRRLRPRGRTASAATTHVCRPGRKVPSPAPGWTAAAAALWIARAADRARGRSVRCTDIKRRGSRRSPSQKPTSHGSTPVESRTPALPAPSAQPWSRSPPSPSSAGTSVTLSRRALCSRARASPSATCKRRSQSSGGTSRPRTSRFTQSVPTERMKRRRPTRRRYAAPLPPAPAPAECGCRLRGLVSRLPLYRVSAASTSTVQS
eukprot:scaffold408_cov388-Prasinococcus_capsulatus_cf.AAC.24